MTNALATLSDRLTTLLDLFLRATGRECHKRQAVLTQALAGGVVRRIRGLERRFTALLALWQAGKLRPPRPRAPRSPDAPRPARPPDTPEERMRRRAAWAEANLPPALAAAMRPGTPLALSVEANEALPTSRLPRGFAWMHRLFPESAPPATGLLDAMLRNEAEMQAFVAAVPRAGRILRPLCHMFGIRPPDWLALPRRPKVRKKDRAAATPHPPATRAPPSPSRGEGKPKLSSVAFGNLIHPEREPMGWRPPNRIGYARAKPFPR